jgi:oligopeptide transport system substrate-binding protein
VKRDIPDAITQSASLHAVYVAFRSDVAPWNDVRVRKALSLALDREAFSLAYTQGQGPPFATFAYPGTPWATPESELKTWPGYNPATKRADIDEAKRLLREAGVDLSAIKLSVPIYQGAEKSAEVFVSLWGSALGTSWTVSVQDVATFRQTGADRNFGIYGSLQSSAFTDPIASVDPWFRSTGSSNVGKFVDATVDARLDEMNRTVDENRRAQITRQLEREILVDKVWYIIGTNGLKNHAWRGWLKGYSGYAFASEATSNTPERWWLER